MDTTYRFRILIYLAAFMLVMSVCFAYAEPLPAQNHLLFQVTPQHAGFLVPSTQEPIFDPAALSATAPVVSPQTLEQLQNGSRTHHSFFHHAKHLETRPVPANAESESSVLGLTIESPTAASTTP